MRVPRAVANFNRAVTNPIARSLTPWLPCLGTLEHTGRKSGKRYRTPLLVFKSRDGYVILIGYGPESDWLKNVLAGGPIILHKRGGTAIPLASPRIVSKSEAPPPRYARTPTVLPPVPVRRSGIGTHENYVGG